MVDGNPSFTNKASSPRRPSLGFATCAPIGSRSASTGGSATVDATRAHTQATDRTAGAPRHGASGDLDHCLSGRRDARKTPERFGSGGQGDGLPPDRSGGIPSIHAGSRPSRCHPLSAGFALLQPATPEVAGRVPSLPSLEVPARGWFPYLMVTSGTLRHGPHLAQTPSRTG